MKTKRFNDDPYELVELGRQYRYADPKVMWYAAGTYEDDGTISFIPITATSDLAEVKRSVTWANKRHHEVRKLSTTRDDPVRI